VIAVDLGGTKIVAALVHPSGRVLGRERVPTMAAAGQAQAIEQIYLGIDNLRAQTGVGILETAGICVAAAGPVDMDRGIITTSPHLPGWQSVPLGKIIGERYQTVSFLINDAKAAVLGEHRFGAGQGTANFICITLGTGIGGGIISNGKMYFGQNGAAGEMGHMTIDNHGIKCSCGNTGCWETLASGSAIERETVRCLADGEPSILKSLLKDGAAVTASQVGEAARQNDALALSVISWAAGHLGTGLVNLVNIFNPEMIAIGGGLAKIGPLLIEPAIAVVRQRAFKLMADNVAIVPSKLGDDIAVLGAAAYVFEKGM
jgi:glucokinase